MKNIIVVCTVLGLVLTPSLQSQTWDVVGPYGGWVNDVAKDGSGNIYAGTYLGGIFKTTDNGNEWIQIYNDTLIIDARSVALNSAGDIFVGLNPGFLRSTNGGASWQKIVNSLNSRTVVVLLVLPNGNILAGGSPFGVFLSTNNGTTFTALNNGLANTNVRAIDVKTGNGYLFAATYGGGVFRSTDNGANWVAVNTGITGSRQMEAVAVSSSGDIFTSDGTTIFRSTNNGENWTNLTPPAGEGYSDFAFTPNGIYVSGRRVYKSTDNGMTWTQQHGLPQINFTRLVGSGVTVLAASSGRGTYRSDGTLNANDTWTHVVNGMNNTHVTSIAKAPNGDLYSATRYAGVFRSTNAGRTWVETTPIQYFGSFLTGINSVAVAPNGTVFIGSAAGRWRSTNQGATWTQAGDTYTNVIACNAQGHVFADYGGFIERSTNNGNSWTSVVVPTVQTIADIAFNGDTVYLATGVGAGFGTSRGVYRSMNNGTTWEPFNNGLTNLNVTAIAARSATTAHRGPQCPTPVAGTWGSGVLHYQNGTWITTSVNAEHVRQLKEQTYLLNDFGHLIVAIGVLYARSPDCVLINILNYATHENNCGIIVEDISRGGSGTLAVLVGTNGVGILRGTDVISSIEPDVPIPRGFSLHQNYPNPFNPVTNVEFRIPTASRVSLKVYDLLGREMATLVDEVKAPGVYTVEFGASGMTSGVYFYHLRGGSFAETRKMILLR